MLENSIGCSCLIFFPAVFLFINTQLYLLVFNGPLTVDYPKSSESSPLKAERVVHMDGAQLIGRHDEATIFTLRQLAEATNNFRQDSLLGRGGFGCVYKATLSNGQVCDPGSCFSCFCYSASSLKFCEKC
jgi:hypothetical protein